MPRRRQSRECALQILYLLDASKVSLDEALVHFWEDFPRELEVRGYTETLVRGCLDRQAEVDEAVEKRSINWRLPRMSLVDRNILRLAVYEMLFEDDVPAKVSIDEAIELAKRFGSEDSRSFVNGILDAVYGDLKKD
jgi:N utilization substance protein B